MGSYAATDIFLLVLFFYAKSQHPKITFFGGRISCVTGFVCVSCQHWLSPRQKLLQIVMLCLISRSVVGLEALCVITTVVSDLVVSLLTMTCRPLTRLRAQNSIDLAS